MSFIYSALIFSAEFQSVLAEEIFLDICPSVVFVLGPPFTLSALLGAPFYIPLPLAFENSEPVLIITISRDTDYCVIRVIPEHFPVKA